MIKTNKLNSCCKVKFIFIYNFKLFFKIRYKMKILKLFIKWFHHDFLYMKIMKKELALFLNENDIINIKF